jgi:putative flippase GtrA
VGLVATIVALILFNLLVHGFNTGGFAPLNDHPELAYLIANTVGMAISFRGTTRWAFKERAARHSDGGVVAFVVINFATMLIPMGCLWVSRNLLGDRGRGFAQFLATLDDGRVAIAALAVGCIQACVELSVEYAGDRQTFGGPIGRKQGVAFQIADLEVMLHASRLLTYRAAALKDAMDAGAGVSPAAFKQAASVAKLYSTESAVTATRIATQVFGGYGFMEEYPVTRFYRDAKVLEVGEGTSEVQRMLIARGLGLPVE